LRSEPGGGERSRSACAAQRFVGVAALEQGDGEAGGERIPGSSPIDGHHLRGTGARDLFSAFEQNGALFTDRHVPRERRHDLPVIESAGEIACVPGVATGERFRVTDHTVQAVRLSARRAA